MRRRFHDRGAAVLKLAIPYFDSDPVVTSRDRLLDLAFVEGLLAERWPTTSTSQVRGVRVSRVKYRLGESLRVTYRVDVEHAGHRFEQLISTRTFAASSDAALSAARVAERDEVPVLGLHAVLHDPETSSVWWTFPNDRRIRRVPSLITPDEATCRRLGLGSDVHPTVVEYAPERCVTLRYADYDATRAYLKVYAPDSVDVPRLARLYDSVSAGLRQAGGEFRSPRVLGRDDDVLALEPIPGLPWNSAKAIGTEGIRTAGASALRSLGKAIATLHSLDVPVAHPRFARLDDRRISTSAALIGEARPALATAASALADRLRRTRPAPSDAVLLHGDCHPNNALLSDRGLGLIDLDQSGFGHPAADLGSLIARLHRSALLGEITAEESHLHIEAFLDGYTTVRQPPSAADLDWHIACALLVEQAVRAINRMRADQLAVLDETLNRAASVVPTARALAGSTP